MPRISEEDKARKKESVWSIVQRHNGISETEISAEINVQQRTVNNYLRELDDEAKIYKEGILWFASDFQVTRLQRFDLSAEEAFVLYLAARAFVKQTDKRNEPAEQALNRLAQRLTGSYGVGDEIYQASRELAQRPTKPGYQPIFQTVTRAYLFRRQLKLVYKPYKGEAFKTIFEPYLIEPSAIGYTIYAIGTSSAANGQLRSYKMDRIVSAEMLREEYIIPATFPGLDILRNAWSIMIGEKTERVTLRFSKNVRERVLETNWHPSQGHLKEENGSLSWWVHIANTTDIFPWIRSWGSDVEIIEPAHLRQRMVKHLQKSAEKYNLQPPPERHPYQWLYAKTDRQNPDNIHLLLYHLIDVGSVALEMWQSVLPDSFRIHIAEQLGLSAEAAGHFIAFIASLHDLGKASPAYQKKYSQPWLKEKLKSVGFVLDSARYSEAANDPKTSHAYITTWTLPPLLQTYCGLDERISRKIAQALGGHHGAWPTDASGSRYDDSSYPIWDTARRELIWELRNVFQPPAIGQPPSNESLNVFLTLLSGLVSVVDWVGSRDDENAFPLEKGVLTTREYARRSAAQARKVLSDLGWTGWQPNEKTLDFATMFHYLDEESGVEPRRVQQEIIDLTHDLNAPALVIIEAPTGIGKTEIAFYLADNLLQQHKGRGLYIAMPTQATSNQMFERTCQFLGQRYNDQDFINVQLAHGQAAFDGNVREISLRTIGEDERDGRVVAMSWFNKYSKRTLLAPFGVGTVDQTLMSVLQTKHFFVRLFGLSHKVVIFDEVHAYDTYMSTLFVELLRWLRAIGTSVIMLSATLPSETRSQFVRAYTDEMPALGSHYPAITLAAPDQAAQTYQLIAPDSISLDIRWLDADKQIEHILALSQKGGCIAVICNTVGRSQTIFQHLLDAYDNGKLKIDRDKLILFHARFPPIWRKEIEDKTKRLFGKPEKQEDGTKIDHRPPLAIIIATQVIEQSLDLDFDAMITDLAPIDLLLQRAGRLHRHKIRDGERHDHARQLTIIQPELDEQGIPHFGSDEFIYERYVLLRTYRKIRLLDRIFLPGDTINLIEAVYSKGKPRDDDANWQNALTAAQKKMRLQRHDAGRKAKKQVAGKPDDETLLYDTNLGLEEDNPAIHQTFQAKTRDIGPTLALICLHKTADEDRVLLEPDDVTTVFDLTLKPYPKLTEQLMQRRINVQHWALLEHFLTQNVPTVWKEHSMLRHARPVIFDDNNYEFENEKYRYKLTLDRRLGLKIEGFSKEN